MKKIRNRKNTSLGSASSRAEGESPQKDPLHEDDDIFISDEDIDVLSEDLDSSSDEETEDIMATKYEMYSEFYSTITLFIQEYIGDEVFKNFISKRKHSSENPFVFEVFQSQNKRKNAKKALAVRKKKKMKQAQRKMTAQSQNEEKEAVVEESQKVDEKQKNREMKKLIKDLLPKEPPKPTCYLDDEPEYQIVEVRGEYKKVKVQKETKKISIIEGFAGPKKSSENHWCLPQEQPECHLQDIIQKEKEEEEQKQKLEEQKKKNEEEAKQQAADDEMMKLAIEISMKEFEEEQEKQEKERKEKKLANNSLAQSLKSGEAKSKFSKTGFVPKSLRKDLPRETPEENIPENEHWNYGYRSRPRGRGGRGRYGPPFRGRRPQRGYYRGYY